MSELKIWTWEDVKNWKPTPADLERCRHAEELKIYAQDMGPPPRAEARNRVKRCGERLHKIIWRGRQWAVTKYGVECRDGTYAIAKDRLWENEDRYGWVRHMAGKNWPDLDDFAEALRIARHYHSR